MFKHNKNWKRISQISTNCLTVELSARIVAKTVPVALNELYDVSRSRAASLSRRKWTRGTVSPQSAHTHTHTHTHEQKDSSDIRAFCRRTRRRRWFSQVFSTREPTSSSHHYHRHPLPRVVTVNYGEGLPVNFDRNERRSRRPRLLPRQYSLRLEPRTISPRPRIVWPSNSIVERTQKPTDSVSPAKTKLRRGCEWQPVFRTAFQSSDTVAISVRLLSTSLFRRVIPRRLDVKGLAAEGSTVWRPRANEPRTFCRGVSLFADSFEEGFRNFCERRETRQKYRRFLQGRSGRGCSSRSARTTYRFCGNFTEYKYWISISGGELSAVG